jgi:hypothetical protein
MTILKNGRHSCASGNHEVLSEANLNATRNPYQGITIASRAGNDDFTYSH